MTADSFGPFLHDLSQAHDARERLRGNDPNRLVLDDCEVTALSELPSLPSGRDMLAGLIGLVRGGLPWP